MLISGRPVRITITVLKIFRVNKETVAATVNLLT